MVKQKFLTKLSPHRIIFGVSFLSGLFFQVISIWLAFRIFLSLTRSLHSAEMSLIYFFVVSFMMLLVDLFPAIFFGIGFYNCCKLSLPGKRYIFFIGFGLPALVVVLTIILGIIYTFML